MSKKNGKLHTQFKREMNTGTVATVKQRTKRVMSAAFRESIPAKDTLSRKGVRGRTLMQEVKQVLAERCKITRRNGKSYTSDRFHQVAVGIVESMEDKEFPFIKEFFERDEGKVTQPVEVDVPVKMYGPAAPVDNDQAP